MRHLYEVPFKNWPGLNGAIFALTVNLLSFAILALILLR